MEESRRTGVFARVRRGVAWRLRRTLERTQRIARQGTAPLRLRPTFLVIGAQKSGTTSLHGYLAAHPAVLCATVKEVRYFSPFYSRGDSWYRAHFPLAIRGAMVRRRVGVRPAVGEASTRYLFDPRAPERVYRFNSHMKLIAVLRDPVDRAYSHYQMEHRWGREPLSFEEALEGEEERLGPELRRMLNDPLASSDAAARCSYVTRGRYAEQLELWLRCFPREQLLVLTSEELLRDPTDVMSRVARFLGIPEWRAESYPLKGVREYPPMQAATREELARTFELDNRRLEELLGRRLGWTQPAATTSGRLP